MFMHGEKCELRALEGDDNEAKTFATYVNAGLTTKHMLTGSYPMRTIDCKEVWERERKAGSVQFAVHSWDRKNFIGTCGLYAHREIYRSWEFRILIFDPSAIGHGIGTEATRLTVNYAFQRLNAHRVWLGVNEANVGAIKCYENVGFKHEGRLRDELFCFGKYYDALRMGVLEGEWASIAQSS